MQSLKLDKREEALLVTLTEKYNKLLKPNFISKSLKSLQSKITDVTPSVIKDAINNGLKSLSEADLWNQVMKIAADGFMILEGLASKYTINEEQLLRKYQKKDPSIDSFEKIKTMRSYIIEKHVNSLDLETYASTIIPSAATGAGGFFGLAPNLVISTFVQFRTVQLIAMHYGYNVKDSSDELEYAGAVLTSILSSGSIPDEGGVNEIIMKMMAQAELSSLRSALQKSSVTYSQMAANGGLQKLYVQIRAITNQAAVNALNKAQVKGIENQALRKILEAISKKMTQQTGAKSVPIASALISVLIDTHQITKVKNIANVIYHKRFLLDKEMSNWEKNNDIVEVEDNELIIEMVEK